MDKEDLKSVGLYVGFIVISLIVLSLFFGGNKISDNDPRNLCPQELKNSLEFDAHKMLGYRVSDLVHCFGNYVHVYSFEYDNGHGYTFSFDYGERDMVEDKVIIDYEFWHDYNDEPVKNHYVFTVVDEDSHMIKEAGITIK